MAENPHSIDQPEVSEDKILDGSEPIPADGSGELSAARLVDGYRQAFIDSSIAADPSFTPRFISNAGGAKVLTAIENELRECTSFFMSVAFVTRGGITPLLGVLKELNDRGVPGKILTTDYLTFSDPEALDKLSSMRNLDVKMFPASDVGFHTKGYLFRSADSLRIIVGSANLTQNAITRNWEWNTRIVTTSEGQYAKDIEREFNEVWESSICYKDCCEDYHKRFNVSKLEREKLRIGVAALNLQASKIIEPNKMQEDFSREIERLLRAGQNRALLISATGTGKTYASAFAVRNLLSQSLLHPKKVLFLSHREQINRQAEASYLRVLGGGVHTAQLSGSRQDMVQVKGADIVFSTMTMMAKEDFRTGNFSPDEFGLIIVDECHRIGAESYQDIISYFRPQFLLGMSASPDRTDGFDVYEQFGHNIACEIRLQTALENGLLCPFHYFGITDVCMEQDDANVYASSDVVNESPVTASRKADPERFRRLTSDSRVQHVVDAAEYYGFSGDRVKGLVFCSSTDEAKELSLKFNQTVKNRKSGGSKYYRTIALSGADSVSDRQEAIEKLVSDNEEDYLDYIFTIDVFNEGVDIPEINQVIMLRPTKSAIIFIQQLGRGLRKAVGKEFVVVLDFIANYDNNYLIPVALSGDRSGNKDNLRKGMIEGSDAIKGASTIYFDEISKERIFKAIDAAKMRRKAIVLEGYNSLKFKLGRRPSMVDFDHYGEMDPLCFIDYMGKTHKLFGSYYGFQVAFDGREDTLSDEEKLFLEFISMKFASGKRLNEILLIELIMNGIVEDVMSRWKYSMCSNGLHTGDYTESNLISVMTGHFYEVGGSAKRFSDCIFITNVKDDRWGASEKFIKALKNPDFNDALEDVIAFAKGRYAQYYKSKDLFAVGQKYTYEDVFRLLEWKKSEVSLYVGGYKFDENTRTYPVFVNYVKSETIAATTKYEDHFIDQSRIVCISKSKRTLASKDVETAVNGTYDGMAVRMFLFVRKNKDDDESKEFYYLGRIRSSKEILEDGVKVPYVFKMKGTDVSAVKIGYELETPVEKKLYNYLTLGEV